MSETDSVEKLNLNIPLNSEGLPILAVGSNDVEAVRSTWIGNFNPRLNKEGIPLVAISVSDGTPGTGTTNHAALSNRDLPDQHPISSITNLTETLDRLSTVIPGTYAEIKALRDQSKLVPGNLYRITDYETIYVQPVSLEVRSDSSNLFDVVLLAVGVNQFAPKAYAAHTARTQPPGSVITSATPLDRWQLLYDIDNDTTKYTWATSTGKGVIYQMIDHRANKVPYDFHNIKFRRNKITATSIAALTGKVEGQYLSFATTRTGFTIDANDFKDYLTFPLAAVIINVTVEPTPSNNQLMLGNLVFSPLAAYVFDSVIRGGNQSNTFFGSSIRRTEFGYGFIGNIIIGDCDGCEFGSLNTSNVFAGTVQGVVTGRNFSNNIIAGGFAQCRVGGGCVDNTFYGNFYNSSMDIRHNVAVKNIGY